MTVEVGDMAINSGREQEDKACQKWLVIGSSETRCD